MYLRDDLKAVCFMCDNIPYHTCTVRYVSQMKLMNKNESIKNIARVGMNFDLDLLGGS